MKFMREQAASTRVNRPRKANTAANNPFKAPAPRKAAARPKPAHLPGEAARSFASQPAPDVLVVPSDELNAIDRAAGPPPAKTVGAAVTSGPGVQLVNAEKFNDIDRKADESPWLPAATARSGDAPNHSEQANPSWLRWIWSALAGTLTALASAVHQLTG